MTYGQLLARFAVQLFDEPVRQFSDHALTCAAWRWWDAQPFNCDGCVRDLETGQLHRLTSTVERGGGLCFRVYTVGDVVIFPTQRSDQDVNFHS